MTTRSLQLSGENITVQLRSNARARRLILRIDRKTGNPVVTLPPGVSDREALRFVEKSKGWLVKNLPTHAAGTSLLPGQTIPLRGFPHLIQHTDRQTRPVLLKDGEILVKGAPEHLARRVTDWLRAEARADLHKSVAVHAASLGARPGRITVRDTTSRWGSCSARGSLSFSWRLILAPREILDYVAAHEVAHLKEMNHSDRFWHHVEALVPSYQQHRKWLKKHGNSLHAYGRTVAPLA